MEIENTTQVQMKPESVNQSPLKAATMSRFIGLFALLCSAILPATTESACPKSSFCHCIPMDDEYLLHCPTRSKPEASFDLKVVTDESVRIECINAPLWSDFVLGVRLSLESTQQLIFKNCSPPELDETGMILHQLGMHGVQYLKFEDLQKKLTGSDLLVYPQLKSLMLMNSPMENVDPHLLEGFNKLEELYIRNTNIQIPKNFFSKSSSLNTFELSGNGLTQLPLGIFDGLERIEFLNLWDNEIEQLEAPLFRKLLNLVSLDLHRNSLQSLPANVCQGLKNLQVINLGENNFTSLPQTLLRHTPNIITFKLEYNKRNLTTLPPGFFENLVNLTSISLVHSGLQDLPDDLIYGLTNLKHLKLDRNYLTKLPARLLKDAAELQSLSLYFNDLKDIPNEFFLNMKKLKKLNLGRNKIRNVKAFTFDGLESLEELNMEYNDLAYIHVDAFKSMINLRIAKFSNNKLTLQTDVFDMFGHVSPFNPCINLEELYLSFNNISQIFSDWIVRSQLRVLDLSYNKIDYIESEDLQFVSNFLNVDLRHNSIVEIDLSTLEYISMQQPGGLDSVNRSVTVSLEDNPLVCDCESYDLLRYANNQMEPSARRLISLDLDEVTCNGPEFFHEQKITELKSQELRCIVENSKPQADGDPCASESPCVCWLKPAARSLFVDCAERNLTEAPAWIDTRGVDYVEIDLSDNHLTLPPDMNGAGYNRLWGLNLEGNKIVAVDEDLIAPNLKYLNLKNNDLTSIEPGFLKKLTNDVHVVRLVLADNPWICDCNSRLLTAFLQSNRSFVSDQFDLKCSNANSTLLSFEYKHCPIHVRFMWLFILSSLIVCIFFVILALYFRFKKQIKIWLYGKNLCLCLVSEDDLDQDKIYDAFVSYSHKDENFAINLINTLESGPTPFKICNHQRDWLVGEWIPEQIVRSVEESRRTIIVLSRHFVESTWSKLEFHTAHKQALKEKRNRIIIVLFGDIGPIDKLDNDLKNYLQMNTYVKWGDPRFWQKLHYAMPRSAVKDSVFSSCKMTCINEKEQMKKVVICEEALRDTAWIYEEDSVCSKSEVGSDNESSQVCTTDVGSESSSLPTTVVDSGSSQDSTTEVGSVNSLNSRTEVDSVNSISSSIIAISKSYNSIVTYV